MTILCPCCGREMHASRSPVEALSSAPLPRMERMIVEALAKAYPRAIGTEVLIDALYGDDPDGGPFSPGDNIKVRVSRLRKVLPRYGWSIPVNNAGKGNYGRYRLEPVA